MPFREGWWRCLLHPRATFELLVDNADTIRRLQIELNETSAKAGFVHKEIDELNRVLCEARATVAGDNAYIRASRDGADDDAAATAAMREYDLTLWLEQAATAGWRERLDEWVATQRRLHDMIRPLAKAAAARSRAS
jgi:hypothetical protein